MADPEAFVHLFEDVPIDLRVEVLHTDEQTAPLQFRLPFVPPPFRAVFSSKTLPQFPLPPRRRLDGL